MSISVRKSSRGITIRTTGADADRLLRSMAAALAPKSVSDAPEGLPKPSNSSGRASGAAQPSGVSVTLRDGGSI